MLAVLVEFVTSPSAARDFLALVSENAAASRSGEPGCRQFDVCVDPADATRVFLYELYDGRAAFDEHCRSDHFKRFDAATAGMVVSKAVRLWARHAP
jgi:quinol monooxygenase YgiN